MYIRIFRLVTKYLATDSRGLTVRQQILLIEVHGMMQVDWNIEVDKWKKTMYLSEDATSIWLPAMTSVR